MGLEEETIDDLGEFCIECGAALTEQERAEALESGGPNMCAVCIAEQIPGPPAVEAPDDPAA
ncbi:MAG: hypothetical protein WCO96_04410 [Actinomycetes bacterium]